MTLLKMKKEAVLQMRLQKELDSISCHFLPELPSPWFHSTVMRAPSVMKIPAAAAVDNMGHVVHLRECLLPCLLHASYNKFNSHTLRDQWDD